MQCDSNGYKYSMFDTSHGCTIIDKDLQTKARQLI